MEITLVRQEHKPWGIDGHLYINRKRICDTVEHPTHHKPSGTYKVDLHSNPFRHGDGAMASIYGEIIVGQNAMPGLVTKSQATYDHLYERLKKAWQRRTSVQLKIVG